MDQIALQRDPMNSVGIGRILYIFPGDWYYQMFLFLLTDRVTTHYQSFLTMNEFEKHFLYLYTI